jgi:hypothetical protein
LQRPCPRLHTQRCPKRQLKALRTRSQTALTHRIRLIIPTGRGASGGNETLELVAGTSRYLSRMAGSGRPFPIHRMPCVCRPHTGRTMEIEYSLVISVRTDAPPLLTGRRIKTETFNAEARAVTPMATERLPDVTWTGSKAVWFCSRLVGIRPTMDINRAIRVQSGPGITTFSSPVGDRSD